MEDCASLGAPGSAPMAASGDWISDDSFVPTICYDETAFTATLTCHVEPDCITIDREVNVGFEPNESTRLVGRVE